MGEVLSNVLLWPLVGVLIGMLVSHKKGTPLPYTIVGGFILGPLAFLLFWMNVVSRDERRRKCPYCAEWVQPAAIVCKHCRKDLEPSDEAQETVRRSTVEPHDPPWVSGPRSIAEPTRKPVALIVDEEPGSIGEVERRDVDPSVWERWQSGASHRRVHSRARRAVLITLAATVPLVGGLLALWRSHPEAATVAAGSGSARVLADANVAPDADTTVDVFANVAENGMMLAFNHQLGKFVWIPNTPDPNVDRTPQPATTTPAVDACVRVLIAAVRRCQACAIDKGQGNAPSDRDCWSPAGTPRVERCVDANGVPGSAFNACVQQVTAAPCSVYEHPTWQLPTGCDGNGLADTARWPGPKSLGYLIEAQQLLSTGSGYAAYASTDHGTTIDRLVSCTASQCLMAGFTHEHGQLGQTFPARIEGRTLRAGGQLKLNDGHGEHSEVWTFSDDATAVTISETTVISVDPLPPSHFAGKPGTSALIDCDADKVCAALRASLRARVVADASVTQAQPVDSGTAPMPRSTAPMKPPKSAERDGGLADPFANEAPPDDRQDDAPRSTENVSPTVLQALRDRGETMIAPDERTKVEILSSGKDKVVGSYKLCVTATGDVDVVTTLKSSGFAAYDEKIAHVIKTEWHYKPYTINGRAAPACTAVTFVYSQR